jgi:RNA polymerase sigma-70 factor (ECF subfamily)
MQLTSLIDTYRGPLIGLLLSWGVPWADAVELAQDCFSEAWLKRDACHGNWQDPDTFGAWLHGFARNRYRNWARSRWRHRLRFATFALDQVAAAEDPDAPDTIVALRQAIARLPARQREVILMHYLEETSVKQVAALLKVSEKTVEGRLYQARRNLRRVLDRQPASSAIAKVLLCLTL